MKYFLSFIILLFYHNLIQSQDISAEIEIDKFGNFFITELINNLDISSDTLIIDKNILIHNKYANLIEKTSNYINYKPKSKEISYVMNYPSKNKSNHYIKKNDFIFNSLKYLAYKKNSLPIKKSFDIQVKLPDNYSLIYPDKRDLENKFYLVPPIIAGDFKQERIIDYDVYYLRQEKFNKTQLISIVGLMNDAFNFYTKLFGIVKKPKIIFLPFNGPLLGMTIDNAIVFNSKMLHFKTLKKILIAHETAHLWFGTGGLQFKQREITEGISEYMAIQFLTEKNEIAYLKKQFNYKYYNSEGIYSLKDLNSSNKCNFWLNNNLFITNIGFS